jgi:glycerol-3-phosphate acyltransferase PlsY
VLSLVITIFFSYLVGSVPTALLMGRLLKRIDIRQSGSGNVGAANTFRVLGPLPGVICLLLDAGKGVLAVLVIAALFSATSPLSVTMTKILAGAVAMIGHIFPVWIGFKGGKGVGTGAGVLFSLLPLESLGALLFFVLVVAVTNYISLGSMMAALFMAAAVLVERYGFGLKIPREFVYLTIVVALLVLFTHRSNIHRLARGTEGKFRGGE